MCSRITQLKSENPSSKSAWVRCLCWFSLIERLGKGKIKFPSLYLTLDDGLIIFSKYLLDPSQVLR